MGSAALERLQIWALVAAAIGLVASGVGFVIARNHFFQAYLVAYLLWLGVALGCLGMSLVHGLTGGFWGAASRSILAAGTGTILLLAFLFLPIVAGLPELFVWTREGATTTNFAGMIRQTYLAVPFFLLRAILYFVAWIAVARRVARPSTTSNAADTTGNRWPSRRLSAAALLVVGVTVSFANVDWIMSLEPTWTSTIFPALVAAGDLLIGLAFVVAVVSRLGSRPPFDRAVLPRLLNDLGGLLLALAMLWAYLAFSQLLLVWAGNLNGEIFWYQYRLSNGWQWVGMFVAVALFAVPFVALLSRDAKQSARAMAALSALIVLGGLANAIWLVEPSFPPGPVTAYWLDLALAVGLGGIWLWAFARNLRRNLEVTGRE
jgi:hypothetical protein